tara:strand:- start:1707 stop:2060 length:354 start_codon:yes stop_codon:yes gene_type:complete
MSYFLIFIGGGLGAGSRFLLSNIFGNFSFFGFGVSTLIVNIIGCFFIGFFMVEDQDFSKSLYFFFVIGFLGSFTTFSTFTKEAILFYEQIGIVESLVYIFMTLIICLISTYLSYKFF